MQSFGSGSETAYMMPIPPRTPVDYDDELRSVSVATPLPDLLPRNFDDIKRMRKLRKDAESGQKYVQPRHDLPAPYVNDEECDEFEDATIDTTVEYLSHMKRQQKYELDGPSVEGEISPIFDNGMLYKIVTEDGSWYFYNDTEKYEMHVRFRFGSKSELQPGERVEMFVRSNKELEASLVVYPHETLRLISGKVNGFKCMAKAVALSDNKRKDIFSNDNDAIVQTLTRIADDLGVSVNNLEEGQVLQYCVEKEIPYVDCDFRPCDDSIYNPDEDPYKLRPLPWRRPDGYIPSDQLAEIRLFRRTILPSQVIQGDLGDSYLISAMACLAESPKRVHDLFRHPVSAAHGKIERSLGAYWVTINYNGWWCPVLLDDFLPAFHEGPEFARCAIDLRRMWVGLLEKAYAKIHHSYSNIASGDPLEPLQDFTGFPITRFDPDWADAVNGDDALFKRLIMYNKKGFLTMLYTPRSETNPATASTSALTTTEQTELEEKYKSLGLQLHCGYCVLRTQYVEDLDLCLVQLRNPWGTGEEWDGAWGKRDKRWEKYPSVRAACFPDGGDPTEADRTFWMAWPDVVNTFAGGGVCHVRNGWYDYRVRGEFTDGHPTVALEINVADTINAYIVLSQEDERDDPEVEYAAMLISVSKHNGKNEKMDCTSNVDVEQPDRQLKFNFARDVALRYTFEPEGNPYFVVPRVHDSGISMPYVIGLLLDTYVGNGIKVEFKTIDKSCKLFQNMPSFSVKDMTKDISTEYQIRNPRQPTESMGTELKDERLREFGLYEE
ncbi:calpain-like cysteine peptidase [Trypanosoma theileri]|uniref:Calpain-like cysteine peptidase n=1 Tax=Trypanosoma theileri TaxID=67003 RepID=A0A1X0NJX8_9TRYP|nr:calpain-like cysteine peptidase [Trypanosoma theileri]ORC84763.1 calpain-like cysteine peptidase [Trypanosoma theileri]